MKRPIRFGAGGWRGLLADEITLERVRSVSHAIADHLRSGHAGMPALVAHDHRFLGDRLAAIASEVLASRGVPVLRVGDPVATPVAALAVRRRKVAVGLIFTASHNPAEYQGLKLVSGSGASLHEDELRRIERAAGSARSDSPRTGRAGGVRTIEIRRAYLREWARRIDGAAIARGRPRVFYDAMHGSGAGVLDVALEDAGARVEVRRADPDARFGGSPPDPRPERLAALRQRVRSTRGTRIGLATDGDADRFAVVDTDGRVLSESEAVALLVDHLAQTGRIRRGIALSLATGGLAERIARSHGLPVERTPLGFSHLARSLEEGRADVAADESGGFAWGRVAPGKDGMLAGGLMAEIVATTRAPLARRIAALEREHGRSCCARAALPLRAGTLERVERLRAAPPRRVDGEVARSEPIDAGLRLLLDDGFLILRASSTEPVLRIYAEASGPGRVRRRIAAGCALAARE